MKTLILVRHAKSDWPEDTDDFDRPLADKGLHDAEKMSAYMKENNVHIEKLVSSPALRALSTCKIFNQTYQLGIETNPKLYHPSESNFESVIYDLDDGVNSVAMFSHNNGISNFANMMSHNIFVLPTCGVAGFQIDCNSWSDFEGAKKKLIFYYEPKDIK
ncbi:phosphohistidine phosphatase [Flavobacteriaceae bacterium JJC]|uniref:SixA phosphatase family protein n=1 Tax=Kaistella soli TaxID=2849654 RepID=UPI000B4B3675|nr:histidine phosphatase family protein [Kaistella soli]MBU8881659.1 histidine phosphatase family protein [Kaistella soli]OWK74205.1 phosphohistidine phosphatase [Flavobacteriaceae bacterium JJC]